MHWLEFSSLGSSRCKYVCPRAFAVPPAPNRGLQGDCDYFHKMVDHSNYRTSHSVKAPKTEQHNVKGALCGSVAIIFVNWQLIPDSQLHLLAEDEIFNSQKKTINSWVTTGVTGLKLQLTILTTLNNLFPPVFFRFKKTRKAKSRTVFCLLVTPSTTG
jgi:hypothetical protein